MILKSKPKHLDLKEEAIYFITTHTKDFRPIFRDQRLAQIFFQKFNEYQKALKLEIYGYSLLPNHLHFLIKANSKNHLSYILFRLKGGTSRAINQLLRKKGNLWQDRYYDHVIRNENDFENHLNYIHYNAVKHKLVKRPEDWPWSSYKEFVKRGYYELGWGYSESKEIKNLDYEV
jgi:putative transposase